MALLLRQRLTEGNQRMHKVRLEALTGSVHPPGTRSASIPGAQEGYFLPPCAPRPALHASTLPPRRSASDTASILVIDASPTIRKVVQTTLRRQGYSVVTFPDGETALQWLTAGHDPAPGLILLDIELPGSNGYAIARALQAQPGSVRTPIIMMSRRRGLMARLTSRFVGARHSLCKPFTSAELVNIVRQYLGQRMEAEAASERPGL